MRRRWLASLLIVVVAVGAIYALRATIAARIMTSMAGRTLAADPIAQLPDGLTVALCGAGGPMPDPKRSGPCVAVVAGTHLFEVDAGAAAGRNMTRLGYAPGRVEALFLTHFHSDHIDGLGELTLLRWVGGSRADPLPVIGPAGVERVVAGFNAAYELDARYRVAHHGETVVPPSGQGAVARPFEAPPDGVGTVVWSADGLTVTAFNVRHDPAIPSVGYKFEYGGRSVLISGDTAKSANLEHFAQNVDLLVHAGLSGELVGIIGNAAASAGRANVAKIMADIPSYHTQPIEAAQIAAAGQVKHLLFYHVVPPLLVPGSEAVFLRGVDRIFHGGVTLGRDGTQITLPRDSTDVDISQLAM